MHAREVLLGGRDHLAVDLNEPYLLHRGVAQDLAHGPPIPTSHNEDPPRRGVSEQRGVDEHLVVEGLVPLRKHNLPIQRHDPAEVLGLGELQALVSGSFPDQPASYPEGELDPFRLSLAQPVIASSPATHNSLGTQAPLDLQHLHVLGPEEVPQDLEGRLGNGLVAAGEHIQRHVP